MVLAWNVASRINADLLIVDGLVPERRTPRRFENFAALADRRCTARTFRRVF